MDTAAARIGGRLTTARTGEGLVVGGVVGDGGGGGAVVAGATSGGMVRGWCHGCRESRGTVSAQSRGGRPSNEAEGHARADGGQHRGRGKETRAQHGRWHRRIGIEIGFASSCASSDPPATQCFYERSAS